MSRFVRLTKLTPIEQFISDLVIGRPSYEEAYRNAWAATKQANRLMTQADMAQFVEPDHTDPFGVSWLHPYTPSVDTAALHRQAQEQDRRADLQAKLVIDCADQSLRRLAYALKLNRKRVACGFGKLFNGVPLTVLLQHTMNCSRHVGQWDDNLQLVVPYDQVRTTDADTKRAIVSIEILQRALGLGLHERICEAPCWTVLKIFDGKFLDGKLGESEPDYSRFEAEVIRAAREIIGEAVPQVLSDFDARLLSNAVA